MGVFRWVLLDRSGSEMRSTQEFSSQAEAEGWLASEWQGLADEGAASVSLRGDAGEVYEMSLAGQ